KLPEHSMEFDLTSKTRIIFGVGGIARLGELVAGYGRVLVLYGGGSIRANGVYDEVIAQLSGKEVHEFGGVEPNPEYETVLAAARLARAKGCDFVLGVGGGSVIDAAKFLACIIPLEGGDAWDRLVSGELPR